MSVFLLMFVASELARSTQGRAGRELRLEAPRKMLGNDRHRVAPGLRLGLRVVVRIRVDVVGERGRVAILDELDTCLLYTSPSPRDRSVSRMPSSA